MGTCVSLMAQIVISLHCNRPGFDPWVGKFPEEGNGYPLQYSCLENSMDREPWWDAVHVVTKSQTELSDSDTHTGTCLPPL